MVTYRRQPRHGRTVFHRADLTHYDVDVAGAELIKRATVTLPAGVQYAWPHVSRRYLYVATSSSASGYVPAETEDSLTALPIEPATGALTQHPETIPQLPSPIHPTTWHAFDDMPDA